MRFYTLILVALLELIRNSDTLPTYRRFTRRDVPLIHPSQWRPEDSTMDFIPQREVNIKDVMIRNGILKNLVLRA